MLAGWSHTVALLYCIIAMRLLGEMRVLDLLLSHHTINEYLLYMSRMHQHMQCIAERIPPAQSSENIGMEKNDSHDRQQGY